MKNMKRTIAVLVAVSLMIGCAIGGTMAWLTDTTTEVKNVFTISDIDVELKEHTYDPATDKLTSEETTTGVNNYKMIPGWTIPKDPWVTVKAGSEDCYVFVKVEESGGAITIDSQNYTFDDFINYTIDPNNWAELEAGVYYCKVTDVTSDRNIKVLGYTDENDIFHNNQVYVKPSVTKEMMDAVNVAEEENRPTLTFTAYASQLYKNSAKEEFSAAEAWHNISDPTDKVDYPTTQS